MCIRPFQDSSIGALHAEVAKRMLAIAVMKPEIPAQFTSRPMLPKNALLAPIEAR
jgi:hypothetical protein